MLINLLEQLFIELGQFSSPALYSVLKIFINGQDLFTIIFTGLFEKVRKNSDKKVGTEKADFKLQIIIGKECMICVNKHQRNDRNRHHDHSYGTIS